MFKKIGLTAAVALGAMTAMPAAADAQPYGRAYGYYNNSANAYAYRDGHRRYQRGDYYGRYDRRYDRGYRYTRYGAADDRYHRQYRRW